MNGIDFTEWFHPVAAVECPTCRALPGARCKRPSGHAAAQFHASRGAAADALFVKTHGEQAWIERLSGGGWKVHPNGYSGLPEKAAETPRRAARRTEEPAQLSMGF
jgi:hypothetical protein